MGKYTALAGGLLAGVGKGMVDQDKVNREDVETKRQAALERAKQIREDLHRTEDRALKVELNNATIENKKALQTLQQEFTTDRDNRLHGQKGGLLSKIDTDSEGNRVSITSDGTVKPLGYKAEPSKGKGGDGDGVVDGFGMTATEKRMIDQISAEYKDNFGNVIKQPELVKKLRQLAIDKGNPRIDEIADYVAGSTGAKTTASDARKQALAEAGKRDAWIVGEGFGDMTKDEWVDQRTKELLGVTEKKAAPATPPPKSASPDQQPNKPTQGAATASVDAEYDTQEKITAAFNAGKIDRQKGEELIKALDENTASQYQTADEVRAAYNSGKGKLSREAALKILRDRFGYK